MAKLSVRQGQPVPPATIAANRIGRALLASLRNLAGCIYKTACSTVLHHIGKSLFPYGAKAPFIQHIEVTGINAPIAFHYKLDGAATPHAARFRLLAQKDTQPVIQVPDADVLALPQVLKPQVENPNEEVPIFLTGKVIFLRPAFLVHWFQAGNELEPPEALLAVKAVDTLDRPGVFPCYYTKDIVLYMKSVKQADCLHNTVESPFLVSIPAV